MRISRISTMALATVTTVAITTAAVPSSAAPHPTSRAAATSSASTSTVVAGKRGTLESHVHGTFGRKGTVRGTFVPTRSFVRHGRTFVQGTLSATLRRANGHLVGRTVRHDVALPIHARGAHTSAAALAAAHASCNVLHLVLGPLNLNLLGLKVHLNRVVLDITAQSGSGNLLGNLLCAVAHLLDNTSPNILNLLRLSNLLNRITGILT
ncbi:MAG TPA: hypothetical protein VFH38_09215 [Jatrophihabitans sp.]|nr:hypothetical protein [Jatrophihabitans sp.]